MKVGDLVKHQYGTMQGFGLVLETPTPPTPLGHQPSKILWSAHGQTKLFFMMTRYLEVVK